jgi:hypothetical protein
MVYSIDLDGNEEEEIAKPKIKAMAPSHTLRQGHVSYSQRANIL